jgi:hypothetical protein
MLFQDVIPGILPEPDAPMGRKQGTSAGMAVILPERGLSADKHHDFREIFVFYIPSG